MFWLATTFLILVLLIAATGWLAWHVERLRLRCQQLNRKERAQPKMIALEDTVRMFEPNLPTRPMAAPQRISACDLHFSPWARNARRPLYFHGDTRKLP